MMELFLMSGGKKGKERLASKSGGVRVKGGREGGSSGLQLQ